jgi:hypothetical protein
MAAECCSSEFVHEKSSFEKKFGSGPSYALNRYMENQSFIECGTYF